MAKKAKRQAAEKAGSAKGEGKLTVMDLVIALENIEAWTRAVRHVLDMLPPTLEMPLVPAVSPGRPPKWSCLRIQSLIPARPAWHCELAPDERKKGTPRGGSKDAGEPVAKKRSRRPRR